MERAEATGGTSLRIEHGVFVFNRETLLAWTRCRLLKLRLLDGTLHRLKFALK